MTNSADERPTATDRWQTDWLNSRPVFYNQRTRAVSYRINDVIDLTDLEFDQEGLRYYLDYGYCVFGTTPVRDVRFLQANQTLDWSVDDPVRQRCDPAETFSVDCRASSAVAELLIESVRAWERAADDPVVLPLSGGFDSRFLAIALRRPGNTRALTYAVADQPENCSEIVRARAVAEQLGLPWSRVDLNSIHSEIDEWINLYGCSVHAHGMYQIKFFREIHQLVPRGRLLSGLIGDLWSGANPFVPVSCPDDVRRLGLSHRMHANANAMHQQGSNDLEQHFYKSNSAQLNDPVLQLVWIARLKMILLSYLITVPDRFDLRPWSPFLDIEAALSMAALPASERKKRRWQQNVFRTFNVHDDRLPQGAMTNRLNHRAMQQQPLRPLCEHLLSRIVRPDFVAEVNRHVCRRFDWRDRLMNRLHRPGTDRISQAFGLRDNRRFCYGAYMTLLPLEKLLRAAEGQHG